MRDKSNLWLWQVSAVFILLAFTGLACNLTGKDEQPTSVGGPLRAIVTQILSPAPNSAFKVREPITVQTKVTDPDGTGVTKVELLANGILVDQKPSLNPQGDKEITLNLTWNAPTSPGSYTLVVRPWRGTSQGTTSSVNITVAEGNLAITLQATTSGGGSGTFATPTYNPQCRARIDTDRLNMRRTPNINEDNIIAYFLIGDEAPMLGRLADSSWYNVRAITNPQTTGWVYGPYTTLLGNCSGIQVMTAPSTAVPTATATLQLSQVPRKADIVALPPSGVTSLPADSEGKANATYTFTIQNIGESATGAFTIRISLPNATQQEVSVANLAPGEIFIFPSGGLNVTFNSPGSHRIFYEADARQQVDESNEGNNVSYIDVTVN